jgi:hypothetical protein
MQGVAQQALRSAATRVWRYATLVLSTAALVACAHHGLPDTEEEYGPAQLTVQNQYQLDYDIFVVTEAGQKWRLGLATGNHTSTFEIPKAFVDGGSAHLHFLADPVGGTEPEEGEMVVVNPGDEIDLTLAPY